MQAEDGRSAPPPPYWILDPFPLSQRQADLLAQWHRHRRPNGPPRRSDGFRAEDMVPYMGHAVIAEPAGRDVRVRLFGTTLVRQWGFDLTGKTLAAAPDRHRGELIWLLVCQALDRSIPVAVASPGDGLGSGTNACLALPVDSPTGPQALILIEPYGVQNLSMLAGLSPPFSYRTW